jgi:hypothetical protein
MGLAREFVSTEHQNTVGSLMAFLDLENAARGGLPQIALTKTVPPAAN